MDRAILQARRQADLLYRLVINANVAVLGGWEQHRREYVYLLGYLSAEMRGKATKNDAEQALRLALLASLGNVISLDAALAQLVAERLGGQPMLFRDAASKLAEVEMATNLSMWFNKLALTVGAAEIDLGEIRKNLQMTANQTVSSWFNQARVEMLSLFGGVEETRSALEQRSLFFESKSS